MDRLTDVFHKTLGAVEKGKEEIFDIYEVTRTDVHRLKKELAFLYAEINETIKKVDDQYTREKKLRKRLMEVNKNFNKYNEEQMIETYSVTKDAQTELQLLRARELQLRTRRDEIERSLKNLDNTVARAENLMNQVSLAIRLLKEGINEISQIYSNDQRKDIAFRIMKAQEEERRRIAREIHDGPAQTLANIILRLEIAEKLLAIDQDRAKNELRELNSLVRENLKDIRRIIFDLRPIYIDNLGMAENLRNYIKSYEKTYGIECILAVTGTEKSLSPSIESALFRIFQEGMTNVAKHACSLKCDIFLDFHEDWIAGKIIDYGKGFSPDEILSNPGEHFGLIGIRERIEMYLGKLTITSTLGKGTVFEFGLPYTK